MRNLFWRLLTFGLVVMLVCVFGLGQLANPILAVVAQPENNYLELIKNWKRQQIGSFKESGIVPAYECLSYAALTPAPIYQESLVVFSTDHNYFNFQITVDPNGNTDLYGQEIFVFFFNSKTPQLSYPEFDFFPSMAGGYGTFGAGGESFTMNFSLGTFDPFAPLNPGHNYAVSYVEYFDSLTGACEYNFFGGGVVGDIFDPPNPDYVFDVIYTPPAVYRFWSDQNQGHFYTSNPTERDQVINDYDDFVWRYEGNAFSVIQCTDVFAISVYRFWSDQNQHHFYTSNPTERDQVINDYDDFVWRYEGVAFCAYALDFTIVDDTPLYRFWSDQNQSHFYTSNPTERDLVINNYDDFVWRYEGSTFNVY